MFNVMNEYISFTKKCFHKYLKLILVDFYNKDICEEFINTYIGIRYSDFLDSSSTKLSLQAKIEKAVEQTKKMLLKDMTDYEEIIEVTSLFIPYFYYLDQLYILETQKKTISDIYKDRKSVLDLEDDFVNEMGTMLKEDIKKRKDFLTEFESDTFTLDLKPFNTKDGNQIDVRLLNDIKFPDLYSDLAIRKAEESDVISEDLECITLLQVSALIINNLMTCEFDKVYYVRVSDSLFDKKSKLSRVFGIVDNPYVQDRLRIILNYKCFVKNKADIMELVRNGFVFALNLDDSFEFSSDNIEYLELFDKILIKTDKYYYKDMKNNGKIKSRIISVDEVK